MARNNKKKSSILQGIVYETSSNRRKNGMAGQNWNYAITNCVDIYIYIDIYISWRYKHQCKWASKSWKQEIIENFNSVQHINLATRK